MQILHDEDSRTSEIAKVLQWIKTRGVVVCLPFGCEGRLIKVNKREIIQALKDRQRFNAHLCDYGGDEAWAFKNGDVVHFDSAVCVS